MILHVTDVNVKHFYGHEWYKMLLTWMSLPFTDMNDTNSTDMIVPIFYIHEHYYMLLTRMLENFTNMNVTTCYWHEC